MTSDPEVAPGEARGPLTGLHVVELADGVAGPYTAKLLADFGADVVKIEGLDGDSTRRRGPFPDDVPDPEASGLFAYLNTNKRSIVTDVGAEAGRRTLNDLLRSADIFVIDLPQTRLDDIGLSLSALRDAYSSLVITSITPFGIHGSWSKRRGDELVTYAMGGIAYSTPGVPDAASDLESEPPLHPACFAAETISGAVAAVATLSAVHVRAQCGHGALVEVSQQAAVATMQQRDINNASYPAGPYKHQRVFSTTTTGRMPNFYLPCKDGYVAIPAPLDAHWSRLVEAMGNPDWARTPRFGSGAARTANCLELRRCLTQWTMTVGSDELFALAEQYDLLIFPFYPVRKMVDSAHVRERRSVIDIELGGRRARIPGAPVRMAATPWTLRRPAPRRGEHTKEIEHELRHGGTARGGARLAGTGPQPDAGANVLPLSGVRVLDLGQFIAIPFCTLWLAWMGAEVISVESRRRMTSRTAPPFVPGKTGNPDASGYYNLLYSGKKSVTVDMTTAAGRELVLRLAGRVDVMVDNYSSGVLEKLGLAYDRVSEINPGIVAVSCGAFGRAGPLKGARGLHSAVNLFSGVADVTGYPAGAPRILGGFLPDPLAGTYASFAILSALHHRRQTGRGQFIDLAMYESLMTLIPEAILDLSLNGRDPARIGNRDRVDAPHGIYRCRADDTWIAISTRTQDDWHALCRAAGHMDWQQDPRFADTRARRTNVDELDRAISGWTRTLDVRQATDLLQSHGVAAGPVLRTDELLDDEQLQSLGVVIETEHPVAGVRRQLGLPWRVDKGGSAYRRAPLLGEHTREILTTLAGVSDAEYARLERDGVLQ
ncbi:MAG TPA: CoA transferase [Burkholderiales bacterium]|nr:CoA transferase [Burkholderiales bacterium]